jgi:S-adenosylmethionine/arginine decarboxylase-like enzyme
MDQIIDLVKPRSIFSPSTQELSNINKNSLDDSIKKLQNEKIYLKLCEKFNIKIQDKKRLYNMSIQAMKHRNAKILKIDDIYFASKFMSY